MRKVWLMLLLLIISVKLSAQPTYHDSYADWYLSAGYQRMNQHEMAGFNAYTISAEVLYSFIGSRASFAWGDGYRMFSPMGLLMFFPSLFMDTYGSYGGDTMGSAFFMLCGLSALQFKIPIADYLELTCGWDAMKFTQFKRLDDTFHCTGSLNAGLTCFIGDNFFINGYYEYNHTHNPFIKFMNWLTEAEYAPVDLQPKWLNGHSFGFRIGVMF